jgi:hypothetical protein
VVVLAQVVHQEALVHLVLQEHQEHQEHRVQVLFLIVQHVTLIITGNLTIPHHVIV